MDKDIDSMKPPPPSLSAKDPPLLTLGLARVNIPRLLDMEHSTGTTDRRRSYALEDLQQVEKDKHINDLIMRKIDNAIKEAMSGVSQEMLEKESAISELKNELSTLKSMKGYPQPPPPSCTKPIPSKSATLPRLPRGFRADREPSPGMTASCPAPSLDGSGTGAVPKRNQRVQPPPLTTKKVGKSAPAAWNGGPGDRTGARRGLKTAGPRTGGRAADGSGDRVGSSRGAEACFNEPAASGNVEALKGRMESSSSDDGHAAGPTYSEMSAHLRRLTDEHAKLQAEYARVRTLLQDANVKSASSRLNSPVPSSCSGHGADTTVAGEGGAAPPPWDEGDAAGTSAALCRVQHLLRVEVDKLSPDECCDPGSAGSGLEPPVFDGFKGSFRREVLRLREELLVVQKQLATQTESKNEADQELAVAVTEKDDLKRELVEREALVEQLTKHNDDEMRNLRGTIYELKAILRDRETSFYKVSKRLKDTERETFENKEFMQEENNSLAESLREAEEKLECYRSEVETLSYNLEAKERQYQTLQQAVEQNQTQMQVLQSELHETKDGTRAILVRQWSELSRCSVSICRLQELVESNVGRMLQEAAALGAEGSDASLAVTRPASARASLDGHQLVRAILEAAARGANGLTNGCDSSEAPSVNGTLAEENGAPPAVGGGVVNGEVYANGELQTADLVGSDEVPVDGSGSQTLIGPQLAPQLQELEAKIMSLGQMLHASSSFLVNLLEKSNNEKMRIEDKFLERRKVIEDLQSEVEESNRRRWLLEEKNRNLAKELDETKDSLGNARHSLKDMWDKVNEKATWLINNKKLKEEVDRLRKQNGLVEAEREQVLDQLNEVLAKLSSEASDASARTEDVNHLKEQLVLQRKIAELQRQLADREQEMQENSRRSERHSHILSDNLQKAETEVEKLDGIIDDVLKVLRDIPDLFERFPKLKQLWKDLDGQGHVKSRGQ